MRIVQTIIFLIICNSSLLSQASFGIKSIYTIPFYKTTPLLYDNDNDFVIYRLNVDQHRFLPTLGVFGEYHSENYFIQIGAHYQQSKTNFSFESFFEEEPFKLREQSVKAHYLHVPVTSGISFYNFNFGIGPVFSFLLNYNEVYQEIESLTQSRYPLEAGVKIIGGCYLGNILIELGLEYHFSGIANYYFYNLDRKGFEEKPINLSLQLGYIF